MYEEHPGQCPWFMVYGVSPQSTEERSKEGQSVVLGLWVMMSDEVRLSLAGSKLSPGQSPMSLLAAPTNWYYETCVKKLALCWLIYYIVHCTV
jgi:hypothetical protein